MSPVTTVPVSAFWVEPTERARWSLRRYTVTPGSTPWTCEAGWHQAAVVIGELPVTRDGEGYFHSEPPAPTPHEDSRWPATCEKGCGYAFTALDRWQDFTTVLYRRADTGAEAPLRDQPDGAMWDAFWLGTWCQGPDGLHLMAKCPGGHEWAIDGVASNCTIFTGPKRDVLPYDPNPNGDPRAHRCWIRHGTPPDLTVDKAGHTCAAGAGSIQAGEYHGFLQNGSFTPG